MQKYIFYENTSHFVWQTVCPLSITEAHDLMVCIFGELWQQPESNRPYKTYMYVGHLRFANAVRVCHLRNDTNCIDVSSKLFA